MSSEKLVRCALLVGAVSLACAAPAPEAAAGGVPEGLEPDGLPIVSGKEPLPDPLPRVAAEVNGQPIFTNNVVLVADVAHGEGESPKEKQAYAYRKALQRLIVRELLFQEALRKGFKADSKGVAAAYDEARLNYKDEAAGRPGSMTRRRVVGIWPAGQSRARCSAPSSAHYGAALRSGLRIRPRSTIWRSCASDG